MTRWHFPRRYFSFPLALLTILSVARAGGEETGGVKPPESELLALLPENPESVLYVPDIGRLIQGLHETPFQRIYQDPRYRPLFSPLVEILEVENPELGRMLRRESPTTLSGENAFVTAVYPQYQQEGDKSPRVVLCQAPNGDGGLMLERMLAATGVAASRIQRSTSPIAGRTVIAIQSVRTIREEVKLEGKAKKYRRRQFRERGIEQGDFDMPEISSRRQLVEDLYYAHADFVLHVTGGRSLMEAVLQGLDQEEEQESFSIAPRWARAVRGMRSGPHLVLYQDLHPLDESGRRDLDKDDVRLGLHEIQSLVAGLHLEKDRLSTEVAVYVPRPRVGLGHLLFIPTPIRQAGYETKGFLSVSGYERTMSGLIPEDAVAYSAFSADLAHLWSEAYRILRSGAPDVAEMLDLYFRTQRGRGNFATNFASTFGGRWVTFSRYPDSDRGPRHEPEMTAMMEIRDAEALRPVLDHWIENLAELLNLRAERFSVRGRRFYQLEGAEVLDPELTPLGPIAYLCLTDRWLILSVRREHILAALSQVEAGGFQSPSRTESGILHVADYPHLSSGFAPDRFFEAYSMPTGREQVTLSPILLLLNQALDDASHALIDLERSPRENVWREAFGSLGMALNATEDIVVAEIALMYSRANEEEDQ